jgi:hypothetical protein
MMPPDKMSETHTRAMKRPVPEDFGLTEQQYNEAKERMARSDSDVLLFLKLSGIFFGTLILSVEIDVHLIKSDNGIAGCWIWPASFFIIVFILAGLNYISDLRRESNPIYRKVRLYESALNHFLQTTEQYWKSLRGVALEKALGNLYRKMGYRVRQTKGSGDEGIDLILEKEGAKTVVQCKGHANPVGVGAVRDLYGAMMHFGAPNAVLACPAGFTEGVVQFVSAKPIQLVSVKELIEMAERIQQPTSEALGRDKLKLGGRERKQQPINEVIETDKANFDEKSRRIKEGLEGLCKKYKCKIHTYGLGRYVVSCKNRSVGVDVCEEYVDVFILPYHIHVKRLNLSETEQVGYAVKIEVACILERRRKTNT